MHKRLAPKRLCLKVTVQSSDAAKLLVHSILWYLKSTSLPKLNYALAMHATNSELMCATIHAHIYTHNTKCKCKLDE